MRALPVAIATAVLALAGMAALGTVIVARMPDWLVAPATPRAKPSAPRYFARDPRAMELAERIAEHASLDPQWTRQAVGAARAVEPIKQLVLPAPRAHARKNWQAYRARFVEPIRIRTGVRFWQENATALERAEAEYGVPASIIAGVLGMETLWGQQTGRIRVLDALVTLAVEFPEAHPRAAERRAYFIAELEQFLQLMHAQGTDPREPRGSYAGDMGLPQFMPSSWAQYGVDFDHDGAIDLWSASDAIGSVANYLKAHGWSAGQPVYCATDLATTPSSSLATGGLQPMHTMTALEEHDIHLQSDCAQRLSPDTPLALVELENRERPSTWIAATGNLRALTRYNPSRYYAMAVTKLGTAVQAAAMETKLPAQ
ncbi:lytic transglycosylase domain-containing protein [Diaphorobacter sp. HDW4A]|uniref:lytic murein transglycosylase n=1 Tax=Diaphorobacter sp. HDW4A TaxID=2714924 RepID=UPI001F0FB9BD|nr:lytic murein transglycosylase [Diaphorobacter sp. HDW4A]